MSAIELLQAMAQLTWVALGIVSVVRAVRRPTRTSIDIALFFGAITFSTVQSRVLSAVDMPGEDLIRSSATAAVVAMPYLLLRVMRDFAGVRAAVLRTIEAGLALSIALVLAVGTAVLAVALVVVAYFASVAIYDAVRAAQVASSSHGVTRQRMRAIAAGSYFLGIAVLVAGFGLFAPPLAVFTGGLVQVCALASALSYALGFTPPTGFKKYWQIPEFRAFLARSAVLPRQSLGEIADDVAATAARTLGARATIGLWDEPAGVLRFRQPHGALPQEMGPSAFLGWRVFESQAPLYVPDASAAHPANADAYRRAGVGPLMVAPITAGDRRLGVMEVFASREPIFAEDDLAFVELMAQQAAVLLEARQLINDAARVRAAEESARLKEDFVSAAAHDLKTPLTTIMAQAQLLERRAERAGNVAELPGLRRLVRETGQLSRLVEELLDASRLERGAFPLRPENGDLAGIARAVAARERPGAERIEVVADAAVPVRSDPDRTAQLIDNLVENALKYSPAESPVALRVWAEGGLARLSVSDRGIGIPAEDMPFVFERFRRGSNVDHRRFAGIGLGLYICKGIVDQHGGRIWVESPPGRGTTFHVALPLSAQRERAADATMAAS